MNGRAQSLPGRPRGQLLPVLLVLLCAMLGSCALFEPREPTTETPPPWDALTPREVLADLDRAQAEIQSLAGGFSIAVDPAPPGRPSNLHGVFFVDRRLDKPRIRVKALGAFGRTLFDLVRDGGRIEIYIPHQKTLYQGRIRETRGGQNPWMQAMSEAFTPFSEAEIRPRGSLEIAEDEVILPLKDGLLAMDRRSGLVRRWHRSDVTVIYEQYLIEEELPPLPMVIRVEMPGERLLAMCTLSQVSVNPDLTGAFDLSGYEPERIRSLEDLRPPGPGEG